MNYKKIISAALIFSMSVILICTYYTTVHASKSDTDQEPQADAAEAFVRNFYEAHTEKDFEKVREQMLEEEASDKYIMRMDTLFELGFQKYDNVIVKAYPMKDKNNWLAVVGYEAFFEGIEIGIPGGVVNLVQKQEDGQWKVLTECPEDLGEEALQIMETENIFEWMNGINADYNEIMSEHPEILNWLMAFSKSYDEAVLETSKDKDADIPSMDEEDAEKTKDDIYIVRRGDCLWSIAKKELGSGIRWNELYEWNKDVIGDNPDLILVGMQLKMN